MSATTDDRDQTRLHGEAAVDLSPPQPRPGTTERLDGVIAVTRTRVWVALAVLAATAVGLVVWASVSHIEVDEEVRAVALPGGGFAQVFVPDDGVLAELSAEPGDQLVAGDVVAVVATSDGSRLDVVAPVDGTLIATIGGVGATVTPDDRIALIEPTADLVLRAFVPIDLIQRVNVGDSASVSFEELDGDSAPVAATVGAVNPLPLDVGDVTLAVGDEALAEVLMNGETIVAQVDFELDDDADVAALGTPTDGVTPTFVTALITVVLDRQTPIELVLS